MALRAGPLGLLPDCSGAPAGILHLAAGQARAKASGQGCAGGRGSELPLCWGAEPGGSQGTEEGSNPRRVSVRPSEDLEPGGMRVPPGFCLARSGGGDRRMFSEVRRPTRPHTDWARGAWLVFWGPAFPDLVLSLRRSVGSPCLSTLGAARLHRPWSVCCAHSRCLAFMSWSPRGQQCPGPGLEARATM